MGCSSSSAQTVDQERRPGTKPEPAESNGGETLGVANGTIAEDSKSIQKQLSVQTALLGSVQREADYETEDVLMALEAQEDLGSGEDLLAAPEPEPAAEAHAALDEDTVAPTEDLTSTAVLVDVFASPVETPATIAAPVEDIAPTTAPVEAPATIAAPVDDLASTAAPVEAPAAPIETTVATVEVPASIAPPVDAPAAPLEASAAPKEAPASIAAPVEDVAPTTAPVEAPATITAPVDDLVEAPAAPIETTVATVEVPVSISPPVDAPAAPLEASTAPKEAPGSIAAPVEVPAAPAEDVASTVAPGEAPAATLEAPTAPVEASVCTAAPVDAPADPIEAFVATEEGLASIAPLVDAPSAPVEAPAAPVEAPGSMAAPVGAPSAPVEATPLITPPVEAPAAPVEASAAPVEVPVSSILTIGMVETVDQVEEAVAIEVTVTEASPMVEAIVGSSEKAPEPEHVQADALIVVQDAPDVPAVAKVAVPVGGDSPVQKVASQPVELLAALASQPVETLKPVEFPGPVETSVPVEALAPVEVSGPVEPLLPVEPSLIVDSSKPMEVTAPAELVAIGGILSPIGATVPLIDPEIAAATIPVFPPLAPVGAETQADRQPAGEETKETPAETVLPAEGKPITAGPVQAAEAPEIPAEEPVVEAVQATGKVSDLGVDNADSSAASGAEPTSDNPEVTQSPGASP